MTNGTDVPEQKSGDGCGKAIGIGCLVMLVVLCICGFLVVKFKDRIFCSIMAKGTLVAGEGILGQTQLPEAEREAAMVPIRELAEKIKRGEVSKEQAAAIAEAFAEGPLLMLMMARGAELKYLVPSELPDEEKKAGSITLSRFAWGMTEQKIDNAKAQAAFDKISIKTRDADGKETVQLKQSLTTEELREWLQIMKDAADAAGIEDKHFEVNIPEEIRKAIDAGLKE